MYTAAPSARPASAGMAAPITTRYFTRQIVRIAMLYALLAMLAGVVLIVFGLDLNSRQLLYVFTAGSMIGVPAVLLVDYISFNRFYRPLRQGLQAIEAGEHDSAAIRQALVYAFNFPMLTFIRVMSIHVPTAVLGAVVAMLLQNWLFDTQFTLWHMLGFAGATLIGGTSHAILEYFAVLRAVRALIPFLQQHASPLQAEERAKIVPTSLRQRLLFISIWTAFIPLLTLGITMMIRVSNLLDDLAIANRSQHLQPLILWVVILVSIVTALSIGIALVMSRDMQQLVGQILQAMQRVEAGDLNTRLAVATTDEFAALYTGFNNMTDGLQEREQLHDAFGRYVSPELAKTIISGDTQVRPTTIRASVMFVDIRGFTKMSEKLSPSDAVTLLNRFFAQAEPLIKAEGGWINKFLGDGFMVIFGAPVPYEDHARRATRAALALREVVTQFNRQQNAQQAPAINLGIGIDCGEMVAGTIGSPERLEYTVIGDTVNVASRIEGLNKVFDTTILISQSVYQQVNGEVMARPMPRTMVKGKSQPLQVYAVLR